MRASAGAWAPARAPPCLGTRPLRDQSVYGPVTNTALKTAACVRPALSHLMRVCLNELDAFLVREEHDFTHDNTVSTREQQVKTACSDVRARGGGLCAFLPKSLETHSMVLDVSESWCKEYWSSSTLAAAIDSACVTSVWLAPEASSLGRARQSSLCDVVFSSSCATR